MRYTIYPLLLAILIDGTVPFSPADLDPLCLYPICVTVRIENYRSQPLQNSSRHLQHGILMDIIRPVAAHSQESFFLRKREWSNYGVDGVFVYELGRRQIIIVLSAPYQSNKHGNWIGVAITKEGSMDKTKRNFSYLTNEEEIEKDFESWSMVQRADTSQTAVARAGGITVQGTMGSGPITEAVIKVT